MVNKVEGVFLPQQGLILLYLMDLLLDGSLQRNGEMTGLSKVHTCGKGSPGSPKTNRLKTDKMAGKEEATGTKHKR
jgi:hypothetical protein